MGNNLIKLDNIIELRKSLQEISFTTYGFEGLITTVKKQDLEIILNLWENVEEVFESETNVSVNQSNIYDFEGKNLKISFNTGSFPFFESFSDFIKGNKLEVESSPFYVSELDYLEGSDAEVPSQLEKYFANLSLIKLLESVSDFQKKVGNNIELFFYKSENGLSLMIDYDSDDLISYSSSVINELETQFNDSTDAQERKQIFKNELIGILNKNGNTYKMFLENWDVLIDSYKKSFELYLSGFSFEKIKTASLSHFQDLTERINQTIGKVANYIFAIPIAYVLLLRYFDFDGQNFVGDLLLLLLGTLFFVLVWFVAFKNIDESIDAIEEDIDDFKIKINNNNALKDIINKLDTLKNSKLKAQKDKVKIARTVSILIFLIVFYAFLYIHFGNEIKTFFFTYSYLNPRL